MGFFQRFPKTYSLLILLSCFVLFRVIYFLGVASPHMKKTILVKPTDPEGPDTQATLALAHSPWIVKGNEWLKQTTLMPKVNCKRIINGDEKEIALADKIMKRYPKRGMSYKDILNLAKNCDDFKKKRGYILRALRKRERDFPIAYSIMIYKDIEQFERLLRAIYRPQNYYCIHVDKKSPKMFHRAVQGITGCFPNVFIASTLVDVRWGEFTILQACLICMRDLWQRYKNWKYFLNVSGQEFPLRTNNELVKILKSLNGKSMVKGAKPKQPKIWNRFHYVYERHKRTNKTKIPFRYNFTFFKGSTYVALSHAFVNFTLNSRVANEFLEWVKDTGFPDETFIPSLIANVNFPTPSPPAKPRKTTMVNTRYVNWGNNVCHGKIVRQICINGVGDLHVITTKPQLFVNKFHLDYQYLALDCLEEWFSNKTFGYYQKKLKTSIVMNKRRIVGKQIN